MATETLIFSPKKVTTVIILIIKNTKQSKKVKTVCFQPSVLQILLPVQCCLSNVGRQISCLILLCCLCSHSFEEDIALSDIYLDTLVKSYTPSFVATCSDFIKVKSIWKKQEKTEVKILTLLN